MFRILNPIINHFSFIQKGNDKKIKIFNDGRGPATKTIALAAT